MWLVTTFHRGFERPSRVLQHFGGVLIIVHSVISYGQPSIQRCATIPAITAVEKSTVGVAEGGAVMIRGPSRGLGTFRCRCRWILLFPLLTTLLLLFAQLNPSQASSVVAERDQSTPAGNYISSKADSGSDTPPTVSIFHQVQIPINMVAGIGGSSSSSGVSQHHHSRFHHHHHQQQQHHHHQQQQQQQQQVAPLVAHGYGGYKPAAPSKESSSGTTEEGSILRLLSKNNLYIQSFPNGTVSATGHDSSFYCKYLSCPHCYHRFFYQCWKIIYKAV